jgi:hypothetical protein
MSGSELFGHQEVSGSVYNQVDFFTILQYYNIISILNETNQTKGLKHYEDVY